MKNQDIIKRAQAECGETVTGYRLDITIDSLNAICEAMWNRCKNLMYTFGDWYNEVHNVVGVKAFKFWIDDIRTFKYKKMEAGKYSVFHGERYCA